MKEQPTKQAYDELQSAFDHFNQVLFGGELPQCLITLQREKKTYGYFSSSRFVNHEGLTTDEIALNPTYFTVCPPEEVMQTLVHEMTHMWQHHFGQPGRRGYHNKEWGEKMQEIGLMPSSTGKPGGKTTGEKMADYIIPGGVFESAYKTLLTQNFRVSWSDRFQSPDRVRLAIKAGMLRPTNQVLATLGVSVGETGTVQLEEIRTQTRVKFTCPDCGCNAWGKPSLNLICGNCNKPFKAAS